MSRRRPEYQPDSFHARQAGRLPDLLGIVVDSIADGSIDLSLQVEKRHLAPNGYLHAASVVALADTAAGYGCLAHLPDGASGFTTIELKSNFLGTTLDGRITAHAVLVHGGRTTQIWDATVQGPTGRTIALFRCTQMILWPKA
ncbi:MAG: PaaI family thioesterase [Burkholderiaceae bacterium]